MIKHTEIKTYDYKGTKVTVVIDYDKGQITLAEKKDGYGFVKKNWVFAERDLSYMDGWQTILDGMKYAISEATKELKAQQDEKRKIRETELCEVFDIASSLMNKIKPKKGKK